MEDFWKQLRDPIKGLGLSLVLVILGILLAFTIPGMATRAARNQSQTAIERAQTSISEARAELETEAKWFKPEYLEGPDGSLESALNRAQWELDGNSEGKDGARKLFDNASRGWPSKRLSLYQQVKEAAARASQQAAIVQQRLGEIVRQREEARKTQEEVKADLLELSNDQSGQLDLAEVRFQREAPAYLVKYTGKLEQNLTISRNDHQQALEHVQSAGGFLPEENSQSGDPRMALEELARAKALVDEINVLMEEVTAGLDYQAEASAQARPTTNTALNEVQRAQGHLDQVEAKYRWGRELALAEANRLMLAAAAAQSEAEVILATQVENGKYDFPEAYEKAKQSLSLSGQSITEVINQTTAYEESLGLLTEYDNRQQSARSAIVTARSSYNTLSSYHSQTAWSSVGNNLSQSELLFDLAESNRMQAEGFLDPSQQRFVEAHSMIQSALANLSQISSLSQAIRDRESELESFRSQWPSIEVSASSTIGAQTAQINSYGGYDNRASSDYNTAVTLLNEARNHATGREYQTAVEKAGRAESLASGTGGRAERAYDDEMDRQQRAQEAAEEAVRQAAESSSDSGSSSGGSTDWGGGSSSGGYDSGGYDSGGWDSGGSDSGGWDSGGGSDGGGW